MHAATVERIQRFDDSRITWRPLGDMTGFVASILHVDPVRNFVEFILKFEPDTNTIIHRHGADTYTFVIEGDHVIYEPDGSMRDSRPAGRYSVTRGGDDVHSEGGGPNGCTLLYSVRGDSDHMFDVVDDAFQVIGALRLTDFQQLLDLQNAPA